MRLLLCRNFQCYLCLVLNHQIGVSSLPCGSFEGPVMFANMKDKINNSEFKRFALFLDMFIYDMLKSNGLIVNMKI